MAKKKRRRDWINDLTKRELSMLDVAINRWLKLPEADGFGKVEAAFIQSPWANGPRVKIIIDGDELLFYFRKKFIGFNVVAVWTVKPRERIWSIDSPTKSFETATS